MKQERRAARVAAPPTRGAAISRGWVFAVAGGVAAVALAVGAVVITRGAAEPEPAEPTPVTAASGGLPGLQTGPAPWYAEQDELPARLEAIGVPFSNMEGTALHIHPSLSVYIDGEQAVVPTDIGISPAEQAMAALHTHDEAGTIHVESPVVRDYTLGQFFDVWGVRLSAQCVGGYCARGAKQLKAFADGKPVRDPRAIELRDGEQIVVAFGTRAQIAQATR